MDNELKDRMVEITAEKQNKEKKNKRIVGSLRDLWACNVSAKRSAVNCMGFPCMLHTASLLLLMFFLCV